MELHESSIVVPPNAPATRRSRAIRWGVGLAILALSAAGGLAIHRSMTAMTPRQLLRDARRALMALDYPAAERLAERVPPASREWVDALLIAGEAATKQERYEHAIACYEQIPSDAGERAATARYCAGDLLFRQGEASAAAEHYREALKIQPDDVWSHEQLASLYCTFGCRWQSIPHLFELVRRQRASVNQLVLLGDPDSVLQVTPDVEKYRERAPDDPLPFIALAKSALDSNDPIAARRYARKVVETHPDEIEAWAILGRSLAQLPDEESAFRKWHRQVPQPAETHPDVWLARGMWAREHGEPETAVRCYWEAWRRFPDSREANYQLGQALNRLSPSQASSAAPFLDRAERLEELTNVLFSIFRDASSLASKREAAQLTESLGRLWEAAAWCQVALEQQPGLTSIHTQLRRIAARLNPDLPRVVVDSSLGAGADFARFPLPDWGAGADRAPAESTGALSKASIRFEDSAASTGIEFRYFNGAQPSGAGKLIYQTLGGGVAAIDYDGDLRPDLYFAQGASAPDDRDDHSYRDRLYRNLGDRFVEATLPSGLGDGRYTLGVTAGDIDNDGFQDLYLANAGTNRLYRNNGDGTFTDVSAEAGIAGRHCTASCLIADLNGDGRPDLFDVNYVSEPEVYSLTCEKDGIVRSCDPRLFNADPDRLYLGLGDGRFADISDDCGIDVPHGKGLGVVAADFAGAGLLSLFVANDGTGNFYFINETRSPGEKPRFREAALEAGVAYSEIGKVQASMGIAADDADGDGLLDLFVTNFYNESSAFYHQIAGNVFEDARRRFGLRSPTLYQLGFGTQFLDADLDGHPDLIVTNGHIEDYSDDGKPYRMRPQYFRNLGGKRFEELRADVVGPFFAGEYLGRGLARLDWNGDGREDVVISHLDAPAALLTNDSRQVGHFLSLRLVGAESARDAIGTTVRCEAGGQTRVRQLTAGDGYMASNERQLIFGLGDRPVVDKLTIRWPSGREQTFASLKADSHWLAIEGQVALRPLAVRPAVP